MQLKLFSTVWGENIFLFINKIPIAASFLPMITQNFIITQSFMKLKTSL